MSAPVPASPLRSPLLLLIDPLARRTDGESVRIARDVLCAGAPGVKVCIPDGPEEAERALVRRGSRRPVVIGDDCALLRAVRLLHRERELADAALAVVPVGTASSVALTRGLGLPGDAVSAARTALEGVPRRLDLLIDDSGGVVLGGLRIPALGPGGPGGPGGTGGPGRQRRPGDPWFDGADGALPHGCGVGFEYGLGHGHGCEDAADALGHGIGRDGEEESGRARMGGGAGLSARTREALAWPLRAMAAGRGVGRQGAGDAEREGGAVGRRLRVEVDGELLADLDRPITEVYVATVRGGGGAGAGVGTGAGAGAGRGLAEVTVRPAAPRADPVRAQARAVTVSGPDFRYRADALTGGPVRHRTWTTHADAWSLTLPG